MLMLCMLLIIFLVHCCFWSVIHVPHLPTSCTIDTCLLHYVCALQNCCCVARVTITRRERLQQEPAAWSSYHHNCLVGATAPFCPPDLDVSCFQSHVICAVPVESQKLYGWSGACVGLGSCRAEGWGWGGVGLGHHNWAIGIASSPS